DRTAVSSYRFKGPYPDASDLTVRVRELLRTTLESRPLPEAVLSFDDHGSPWHTRCVVEAHDEPGLLHTLTLAFARAGVNVDGAAITTQGSNAIDAFDLTDKNGAKLDDGTKERVREAVAYGTRHRDRGSIFKR